MVDSSKRASDGLRTAVVAFGVMASALVVHAEPEAAAATHCETRVAERVQARYDTVRDFAADFRQQTRAVALGGQSLGDDAPSVGQVVFSKPGRMRWRYREPRPSEVISNGTILWIVDPVAREAQRLPVTEGYLTGAALEFLLGEGRLLESFEISSPRCAPDADGVVELVLEPKGEASYESLRLWAKSETGDIVRTSLVDLFGNETTMSFSNVILNRPSEIGAFEYEPPKDMSVIDLTPSR